MSDEERETILRLFPNADVGYDNTEQLIIYTGRYAENQMPEGDWDASERLWSKEV